MLSSLKALYTKYNNELHVDIGKRDAIENKLQSYKKRVEDIDIVSEQMTKASVFLQTISDTTRQQVIDRISSIVTDALQKVKDPNLEFKMLLSTERNQVDVKFFVYNKETQQEYDILDSCGGSIADIITFPLKVSLLMKWEPTLARVVVLDENFKFVSVTDQEPLGEFVRQVSEKLKMQTILVTHSPVLASKAHRIFEVTQRMCESKVEERLS